jgi:hypothetical protein
MHATYRTKLADKTAANTDLGVPGAAQASKKAQRSLGFNSSK